MTTLTQPSTTPDTTGASYLRSCLKGLLATQHAHEPRWITKDQDEFVLISDGDRPVATFNRNMLELDIREFYPDGRANATFELRRPYHNPSVRGAIFPCNWRIKSQGVDSLSHRINFEVSGNRLILSVHEEFGPDQTGVSHITFAYDKELGCYSFEKSGELALFEPRMIEMANLWARGAGEAWPEDATLRMTLWSGADGAITWFPHNPLLANLPGNMDVTGPKRRLGAGGFIAMGTRDVSNPAIEILDTHTRAVGCATCSAYYDEHILMGCPTPLDETGHYRWRARTRLVSIPRHAMEHLKQIGKPLELSATADQLDRWSYLDTIRAAGRQVQPFDTSLSLRLGEVNRFDRPIDPNSELVGLYWYYTPQPWGRVSWDAQNQALRIDGRDDRADLNSVPCGPAIRLRHNMPHRLTARVRTELATGASAWIEMTPFLYSHGELKSFNTSATLKGTVSWTTLTVDVPSQHDYDYLHVALRLRGRGSAWFDQVTLTRNNSHH